MSAHVGATAELLARPKASGIAGFRLIPRIETFPGVVKFAQTFAGKLLMLSLFTVGLSFAAKDWFPLGLCLAMVTFLPIKRRLLVTAATLVFAFAVPWPSLLHPLYISALVLLAIATGALLFRLAIAFPRSFYGRHPILVLLASYTLAVLLLSYFPGATPLHRTAWDFVEIFGFYLWFIGYSLLDCRSRDRDGFALQVGAYRPFWGSTVTPFPKGASYLRRIEAQDAQQLAVTQLKGLKLLVWSLLVTVFSKYFSLFVHSYLGVPTFNKSLYQSVIHSPYPWYSCWASLLCLFLEDILTLSIWGHRFIACCRMAGFNAPRNTYRPLSSRTLSEFWNRYYFYFKELLADFFFYPVFLRFFKKNKRLRLVTATFAAAFFGNIFYHFLRDLKVIESLGFWKSLAGFHVYIFYCFLLATGISISQLRAGRQLPPGFLRQRVVPVLCVSLFYMLINVFAYLGRDYTLADHFRYFVHLFQFTA